MPKANSQRLLLTRVTLLAVLAGGVEPLWAQPAAPAPAAPQTPPATPPAAPGAQAPPAGPASAPPGTPSDAPIPNPALDRFESRVIREVRVRGLQNTDEQLVRNQIRSAVGRPLRRVTVEDDVQRLTRLGRFATMNAFVEPFDDGTVALVYEFEETPIIKDVQVVGNVELSDQDLAGVVTLLAGTPVDRFQIDRAVRQIEELYRKKGYYQASVTIDEDELKNQGIVLFRIREGTRLKITDIRFEGNDSFPQGQIRQVIKTEARWLFFFGGTLDDQQLDADVAEIIRFYRDRGHLDARVDRRLTPSPDGSEMIVTFLIEEGPRYTLRSVRVELGGEGGLPSGKDTTVFTPQQLAALIEIKPGDVYKVAEVDKAVEAVQSAYGQLGYGEAQAARAELRDPEKPLVDLLILVREGTPSTTGLVIIRGNELTQDKVVRREVELQSDRPLDATAIDRTRENLRARGLFAAEQERRPGPRVTVQPADPANPGVRDVLVEVEEKNTGALSLGAALSSDSGVLGQISLTQRNFDLFDTPDSFGEFITGRAFRGAGQTFSIAAQPGTEIQNYSIGLTDPAFLGSDYSAGGTLFYATRDYDEYNESRLGGSFFVGRQFGQVWSGSLSVRAQQIDASGISFFSPDEVRDVEGVNVLTGLGGRLSRTTFDSRIRPTTGSRLEFGAERVGIFGGDFDFTKLDTEYQVYFPIFEDYLGRKTILSIRTAAAWIPEGTDEAPVYERYYLGGRSFRGFAFRGVSPRGPTNRFLGIGPGGVILFDRTESEDPVGGTWSFFFGPQVEVPLVQKVISLVGFVDTGTVTRSMGWHDYRVSAGFGLRLYIPQLSQAPLAFDLGFPIVKIDKDEERVFSFSVDLPF
jgi:outer membrane protein insertion porin family